MQRAALHTVESRSYVAGGEAPLLDIFGNEDPFKPIGSRDDLRRKLGPRVSTMVIDDASHAPFPEQPQAIADAIVPWASRFL